MNDGLPYIKEKIFDGVYLLTDKSFLVWNSMLRGWFISGPIYFDILENPENEVRVELYM